jgi:predicted nucleic acid-binding protein
LLKNSPMHETVIVDASVLIALERIELLPILCKIYKEIILPDTVVKEFGNINIICHSARKVESRLINVLMRDLNLGKGESEVIALAYETKFKALIDDLKARKVAEDFGVSISGSIGVLLKAEKLGLIDRALRKTQELKDKGFHVSNELLADIAKYKP